MMAELLAALFDVHWETVSLVELLWTLGALLAFLVALAAIWRTWARSTYLHRLANSEARRWVNGDMFFRRSVLALVMELAVFLGLWSMLEPQASGTTSSAAIAGLAFWLVELAIIAVVLHEELVYWRIRQLSEWDANAG